MKKFIFYSSLVMAVSFVGILNGQVYAQDPVFTLKYDVWISPGRIDIGPPFNPFHDCLRIDFDGVNWTMAIEGCTSPGTPPGPAWANPGVYNTFGGQTCGTQHVRGWYLNSAGLPGGERTRNVIGGVMADLDRGKVWGFEGVRNDTCTP